MNDKIQYFSGGGEYNRNKNERNLADVYNLIGRRISKVYIMNKSNKGKIAFFLDVQKELGGAGNLLLQQAVLMSELYDVIVVVPISPEGYYNSEYIRRCKLYDMPYVCIRYCTACDFSQIDFVESMNSVVEIENFAERENIFFFHSVQLNLAVEYVSRKLKIPHLMDIYQLHDEGFQICPRDIYPHYHLCDSLLYADRWSSHLGIHSRCVRPIAFLNKIKKKKTYELDKFKILMLGTVCTRKNQMAAIKALEQLIQMSGVIELHIAGNADNDYAQNCKRYVKEHGLEQFIIFYEFVKDITLLLDDCDCLLCSSVDESFPSSIVEALTYDLTIISTPVAGVPEVFHDKVNSFISRDFSEKCINTSILECMEYYKNGKIYDIHRKAEKTWTENFERSLIRKQIDLYYKDIISDRSNYNVLPFGEVKEDIQQTASLLYDINDDGEKWICKRYLYYTFIRKRLCKGRMYIWGAGKLGRLAFELLGRLCPNLKIVAFIDTYKEGFYLGLPIVKKEDISVVTSDFYSISFGGDRDAAIEYLKDKGLEIDRQIWMIP